MNKKLTIVAICYFLVGCSTITVPAMLGISDLEWSSYSPEKQKSLLSDYEQVVKESPGIADEQDNANQNKEFLAVNIYDGKIMFPPSFINWQNYKPVRFAVLPEECTKVEMVHLDNEDLKTELRVCWHNDTLYLDPSHYDLTKKYGSVGIHSSPLWLTGFAYKGINSNGYVRLSNVTVEVKQGEREGVRS